MLGGVGSAGGAGAASKTKLIKLIKGWRAQGLKNEHQTSVQLRSSEQREANVPSLEVEQPPTLVHSTLY